MNKPKWIPAAHNRTKTAAPYVEPMSLREAQGQLDSGKYLAGSTVHRMLLGIVAIFTISRQKVEAAEAERDAAKKKAGDEANEARQQLSAAIQNGIRDREALRSVLNSDIADRDAAFARYRRRAWYISIGLGVLVSFLTGIVAWLLVN